MLLKVCTVKYVLNCALPLILAKKADVQRCLLCVGVFFFLTPGLCGTLSYTSETKTSPRSREPTQTWLGSEMDDMPSGAGPLFLSEWIQEMRTYH